MGPLCCAGHGARAWPGDPQLSLQPGGHGAPSLGPQSCSWYGGEPTSHLHPALWVLLPIPQGPQVVPPTCPAPLDSGHPILLSRLSTLVCLWWEGCGWPSSIWGLPCQQDAGRASEWGSEAPQHREEPVLVPGNVVLLLCSVLWPCSGHGLDPAQLFHILKRKSMWEMSWNVTSKIRSQRDGVPQPRSPG